MEKYLSFLMFVCLVFAAGPASPAATRSGIVTMDVDLSAHEAGKEVKLWIPYPVSDHDQLITNVKVSGDYAKSAVYTDPQYGNAILFASWDANATSRKLSFSFAAERKEVVRRDFPATEPAWDRTYMEPYLTATSLGPVTGEVKALADKITAGQKTVLGKATAIYEWVYTNMYRDPDTPGCGLGDVDILLHKLGGKCTDISSVFIALAKASGVPAREVFGIRLGKKPEEDITGYQHCWAEFYEPGYGWVPVDPADVRKAMLVEKLKLNDPKTVQYIKYFWGGIDPYRIKIASGRDITLNPPQAGKPLNDFGYPFAQVGDNNVDWLAPATFKYRIMYKEK